MVNNLPAFLKTLLFDPRGHAPHCVRVVDLAHDTSIEGDISHSSIAGTVKDAPDARILTPTDLVEVCIMVDFICFCFTSYATNQPISL
jgi:hypothetical protein